MPMVPDRDNPKRIRVHREDPRNDLPCDWCGEVKLTTANSVWCTSDPEGWISRICKDCEQTFAG